MARLPISSPCPDIGRNGPDLQSLKADIKNCTLCAHELDRRPNPILQVSDTAKVLIASQAPGNIADKLSLPFKDPSGVRLRDWMGVSEAEFYDPRMVAIVPMGFCFPGYDKNGGDKPPIKRCAETWRASVLQRLPNLRLTLLIGRYAQNWHLPDTKNQSLTDIVRDHDTYLRRGLLPLPHPSWRNNQWLRRNPWFETDVIPELRRQVQRHLQ